MAPIQAVGFLLSFVLVIAANVSANKYTRRALETKGVFPVLEAKEEYELNKRSFEERQSTGLIATDCNPCSPFDPEAVEKGDTHCSPGLKPVKRCDAKCGCESWDCVRENCDVWIKSNAKNFTGPCLNDKTGEVEHCETRTKEEWNCGCKVMACERNCEKSHPLPASFEGCDKDCSFQVYGHCSCPLDECSPFAVPTSGDQRCSQGSDCGNPKCEHCVKTFPYGDKCAHLFPNVHIVGACKPNPPKPSPCNICKNEVTLVEGEDSCGDPIYECETKPEAPDGVCEYCEIPLILPLPDDGCEGKKNGKNVTLCDRKDPLPTHPPCPAPACDFCHENVKIMPADTTKRCPTCPAMKCVRIEMPKPKPTAPKKCCTGENPAGELIKIRDHPKCEETVCLLDCDRRESAMHCDPCTQTVETTDKIDDCGCQIKKCVDLPPVIEAPEEGCGDCLKKITKSKNPSNKECKETVEICVKKGAIYQIVEKPEDIVLPDDPEDPDDENLDKKKEVFKIADEKIIEVMEPEEFLEVLDKVPKDVPVLLNGDKVVVKTKPKSPIGEEKPGEFFPAEYIIKPIIEEKKPTLKVYVFTQETCPNIGEETRCHLKGKTAKVCDCVVHKEVFPVEQCNKTECPTECVEIKKPPALVLPKNGKCQKITEHCIDKTCKDLDMTQCDETHKETTKMEDCESENGEPSCMEREVTITYEIKVIPDGQKDGPTKCCAAKTKKGECKPKKCPETTCDDVCEERRVVQESDACGCTKHECVPKSTCSRRCGKCEICSKVKDSKKQCQTYKCVPKPPIDIGRCQTVEKDENGVVQEDECGHPKVVAKCGPKAEMLNPCPEGKVQQQVFDECGCALCDPQCCVVICKNETKGKTCAPCEEKKTIPTNGGNCKEEICLPKNCIPPKQVDCPSCMHLENKPTACDCVKAECVRTPCKEVNKSLKCKEHEKLVVKKDSCGCVTTICEVQACKAECGIGEVCKERACKCEKTLTPCRQMRSKMLLTSLKLPNVVVPECDPITGAYSKK